MFVRISKRGNRKYLSFAESYRNEDGKPRQRIVEHIGYLDELEKEYPDALNHFKALASERTQALSNKEKKPEAPKLNLKAELMPDTIPFSLGYGPVKALFGELNLPKFWRRIQRRKNHEYSLYEIFLLLVADRFLHPSSKRGAFLSKDQLFERGDFELHDVYRALREFACASSELQSHLYHQVQSLEGLHDETGYYDVTNFYFEIPYEDEDTLDENGNIQHKGLRRRGASKEHRKDPIVQMGLLMDSRGLPLAFHKYPGNGSEKTHLVPAVRGIKQQYELERIIIVADRGLNTATNISYLAGENNSEQTHHDGYIFGQSVRGASREFKDWMFADAGWEYTKETDRNDKSFSLRHKSRVIAVTRRPKDKDGRKYKPFTTYQKQVVFYSEKRARKDARDREKAVAKARMLIENPEKFTKATTLGAAGYIKNLHFSKTTGEVVNAKVLQLDEEKINAEVLFDGYFSIVTSETEMEDLALLEKYRGLWEIEESFRILKSEFRTRPMYVSSDEAIEAHLLICFTALLVMRLLEKRLGNEFTVRHIRESLADMNCAYAEGGYYQPETDEKAS